MTSAPSAEDTARDQERAATSGDRARVTQLDVLRGIAILLVLGRHRYATDLWMRAGWVGVDLFFVLSGFLVSGLLFTEYRKHGKIDLLRFFVRRGLKIYPGFYVLLLVTVANILRAGYRPFLKKALAEFFFVQNYLPGLWSHTWSLAVEEHFYLLLAASLYLLSRCARNRADPFRMLPGAFLVTALVILALRAVTTALKPFDAATHLYPTHLRMDSLLFGVVLSYLYHYHHSGFTNFVQARRGLLFAAGGVLVSPCLLLNVEGAFMPTVGFTCLYLGFGALLLVALYPKGSLPAPIRRFTGPLARLLAWIGVSSYSIYLWHVSVANWGMHRLERWFGLPHWIDFTIYVVAAVLTGIALARLIEMPVLRLRDRLYPPRSGNLMLPPATGPASRP